MTKVQRWFPTALRLRSLQRAMWVLLAVLVLMQTLGVLHRVAHAKQSTGMVSHGTSVVLTEDVSLWVAVWGEHSNSAECQLFDQACPDLLHVPVWALPVVATVPTLAGATMTQRWVLFERFYALRGPPATLL